MKNYVPINKQSKKAQKAYYDAQRVTWDGLNPATRTIANGKGYDRNKMKREDRKSRIVVILLLVLDKLFFYDFHIFSGKGNAIFRDFPDSTIFHIGIIVLFLNLHQCLFCRCRQSG